MFIIKKYFFNFYQFEKSQFVGNGFTSLLVKNGLCVNNGVFIYLVYFQVVVDVVRVNKS